VEECGKSKRSMRSRGKRSVYMEARTLRNGITYMSALTV